MSNRKYTTRGGRNGGKRKFDRFAQEQDQLFQQFLAEEKQQSVALPGELVSQEGKGGGKVEAQDKGSFKGKGSVADKGSGSKGKAKDDGNSEQQRKGHAAKGKGEGKAEGSDKGNLQGKGLVANAGSGSKGKDNSEEQGKGHTSKGKGDGKVGKQSKGNAKGKGPFADQGSGSKGQGNEGKGKGKQLTVAKVFQFEKVPAQATSSNNNKAKGKGKELRPLVGTGYVDVDGYHYPFNSYRHEFEVGQMVCFETYKPAPYNDDLAMAVGVRPLQG